MKNEIALPAGAAPQKPTQERVFKGPVSDYLWKELIGEGHAWVARMNDERSHASLVSASVTNHYQGQANRWAFIAVVVPALVIGSCALVQWGRAEWDKREQRLQAEATIEKARAVRAEQEAKVAAEQKAYNDAVASADKQWAAFMAGAAGSPQYYATAADMAPGAQGVAGVQESVQSILAGKPLDHVKPIEVPGAWSAPVVFKKIAGDRGDFYLVGVAIDDNGVRKSMPLLVFGGNVYGLRSSVAEAEAKAFHAEQSFRAAQFSNVRDAVIRGFFVAK